MFKEIKTLKKLNNNTSIKFYEVSKDYLDYLRKFENKIPNIEYKNREKFVAGVLFKINDMNYIAPVSSFNKPQRTNYVLKFGDYPVGSIRFSFMMPVPSSELRLKDFTADSDDYKRLVKSELSVCNKNNATICNKAYSVYNNRINNKNSIYNEVCCDFKVLESKCQEWIKMKSKELTPTLHEKNTENGKNNLTLQQRLNNAKMTKKAQNKNEPAPKKTIDIKER